jgi:aryl-alcohol dehydrogenase-like predicted oxidoreductase
MPATDEGTKRYADRMKTVTAEGHFRECHGLVMSSVGLGTYLGDADSSTDENYRGAIVLALQNGVNVLDTAINYRFQRSERSIGQALHDVTSSGRVAKDEVVIATKAGYLSFDGAPPTNPREYFTDTFVRPGIIGPGDLIAGSHCMTPRYLQHQLDQSLGNLGVHTIDIFYLHNPETQLSEIDRTEFYKRLRVAFGFLEGAVRSGKIRMYGMATWNAFRVAPESPDYISIEDVVGCAHDVAGDDHHFLVAQLPYNLAMTEAYTSRNQKLDGKVVTMLEACGALGISVMASASLLQSRLTRNLPDAVAEHIHGLKTDSQRAIQFVRSTPGISVALVGMSRTNHVEENVLVTTVPPNPEAISRLFDAA